MMHIAITFTESTIKCSNWTLFFYSWGKWISIWGSLWKQGAMTTLDKRGSIKIRGWSMTAGPALVVWVHWHEQLQWCFRWGLV